MAALSRREIPNETGGGSKPLDLFDESHEADLVQNRAAMTAGNQP
jgi:hypothetical protein